MTVTDMTPIAALCVKSTAALLRLALLLPFVWLLLESSKKIPLPETARRA
jgi:hypothetical protein